MVTNSGDLEHINIIGYDIANIATIVSLKLEEENNTKFFRLLLRTKDVSILLSNLTSGLIY